MAKHFNTVILSADSRQCYKELNIGVARPTPQELREVKHYFIASHSIHNNINAAWYELNALHLLNDLFIQRDIVIVTGGTGLYIKALIEGLDIIPETNPEIRKIIISNYDSKGINWLRDELIKQDPLFAAKGELLNPQRMMRALEVKANTGKSIIDYHNNSAKTQRPFNTIQIGLDLPRDILYKRINVRVDSMIQAGLEQEALALLPYRKYTALQTVGYKEFFNYFDGTLSLQQAIEQIKQHTRNYAKRQLTWFKKQPAIHWFTPVEKESIIPAVERFL